MNEIGRCYLLLVFIILLSIDGFSSILTVKQDGTGDFTIIQHAIDASENGDTVLVYPGTYFENLEIIEKNIALGSLTLTTGNLEYIHQTIIDGNQAGGCINIYNSLSKIVVNGFVLRNGTGSLSGAINGGGIYVEEADLDILNCVIEENFVSGSGGGINARSANIFISNTTIRDNSAYRSGGGMRLLGSTCLFDTINLCNIYNNVAAIGTDIYYATAPPYIYTHVVVDTFTVIAPDYYHLFSKAYDTLIPGNTLSWEILNGKLDQTTENIYVSNNGDNNNSGLTPDDPLKNIWSALLRMKSDSISPDTIILADGIYSFTNGEKFPLSLKRDVSIRGESRDGTILDAEDEIYHLSGIYFANNYNISNITLTNGNGDKNAPYGMGSLMIEKNINASLTNILFTSNTGKRLANGEVVGSNNFRIDNCDFIDNYGRALAVSHGDFFLGYQDTTYVTNCRFIRNNAVGNDEYHIGGGLSISSGINDPYLDECVVINCLFVDNYTKDIGNGAGSIGLGTYGVLNSNAINCTFADNTSNNSQAAALSITYGSTHKLYNSIVFNNQYRSAYMFTPDYTGESNFYVENSLFDGGEDNINLLYGQNNVFYGESNIDTDPLFYAGPDFPYNLANNSPCIDAGSLEIIPDWIQLPETDLAGNPRIYGETIDMGAYEWNPTVDIPEIVSDTEEEVLLLSPNPASISVDIEVKTSGSNRLNIEIYNQNGQRVATILSGKVESGIIRTIWDLTSNGSKVLPGIYYVTISENEILMKTKKLVIR